jgi:CheY-like chemotaxis protein
MTDRASRPRITLIEDNAADVFLIKKALQAKNIDCDVTHFEAGDQALAALMLNNADLPDLILLDLNLPRTDGLDILRAIRTRPRLANIPVAIMTSSEASSDKHRASALGAVRYIMKPPELEDFLTQVGDAISDLLFAKSDRT